MNPDLVWIALAVVTWGVGEGMFLYFEPLYLQELGADPRLIGAILGGIGVAMTAAYLPAGFLADRFGRRPLLFAAWIIGVLAAWGMALAPNLGWFVAASALYGMTSFVAVPLNSYITAARGSWSVGRAITLSTASFNLGTILGPLLGGWIGKNFGLQRTFLAAAVVFIFSTLFILFIHRQPVERRLPGAQENNWKELWRPSYLRFLMIIFLVMLCMYLPQPLSQNYLQNERGLDLEAIGRLISLRGLGVVSISLVLGSLNARLGFLLTQVAMAAFSLLLWRGTGWPALAVGYFFLGSYQTARSLASAQGHTLIHVSYMGLAYGAIETVIAAAIILAPPLAGMLYTLNPAWVYSSSLVLMSAAFLLTWGWLPSRPKETI